MLPKISVIPNLEHLVVDGGSSDNKVDILRRYAARLSWWVSEKDRGQSRAINKGLEHATGDILCRLNSDDYFASHALWRVAEVMQQAGAAALAADHVRRHADGSPPFHARALRRPAPAAGLLDALPDAPAVHLLAPRGVRESRAAARRPAPDHGLRLLAAHQPALLGWRRCAPHVRVYPALCEAPATCSPPRRTQCRSRAR
jgi:glycosyltransferase involved in cell wall biosynthesis